MCRKALSHALSAYAYDPTGLWVENQWSTPWGYHGWVHVSWSYVDRYVTTIATITPLTAGEEYSL